MNFFRIIFANFLLLTFFIPGNVHQETTQDVPRLLKEDASSITDAARILSGSSIMAMAFLKKYSIRYFSLCLQQYQRARGRNQGCHWLMISLQKDMAGN